MSDERQRAYGPRKAAVLGSPVSHSRSPALHRAAYAALGLSGWTYTAIECDEAALPDLVDGLGPEWVGLSVTMPGKRAALSRADVRTERARAVESANTLVRLPDGRWQADCTDIDGVSGALRARGWVRATTERALLLGAGATASAAVAGLADLGIRHVTLMVRRPERAEGTATVARRLGLDVDVVTWDPALPLAGEVDVVVSTVPAGVADAAAPAAARASMVLDVVYHPWPTPMAQAVLAAGGQLATGLDMLLHQAFGQVEQFTGMPAPREVMADVLGELARDR
ncbi:MAG TPA: shikimate dehydrogenase [Pseudonocardia sp.]|jgi:shikimate dehydrogenase|nr:shikimate dehydrogenase [Pseudonocardia sp.]